MSEFDTFQDFLDKVTWEGGFIDALEYGLKADDIPEDAPEEFVILWEEAQVAHLKLQELEYKFDKLYGE